MDDNFSLWLRGYITTGKLAELSGIEKRKLEPLLTSLVFTMAAMVEEAPDKEAIAQAMLMKAPIVLDCVDLRKIPDTALTFLTLPQWNRLDLEVKKQ